MTHAFLGRERSQSRAADSKNPASTSRSAYLHPCSYCAYLLEPVRVRWVAQVTSLAADKAVDAPRCVVPLALLASLALFPQISRIVVLWVGILAKGAKCASSRSVAPFRSLMRQYPVPNITLLARLDAERALGPL